MAKNNVVMISIPEARYMELLKAEAELKAVVSGSVNKPAPVHEVGFQKPTTAKVEPSTASDKDLAVVIDALKNDKFTKDARGYYKVYQLKNLAYYHKKGEKVTCNTATMTAIKSAYPELWK